jgi:hypothetical protein
MSKLTLDRFYALLTPFMELLEKEMNEETERLFPNSLNKMGIAEGRRGYNEIGFDEGGKRFVRVWQNNGQKSVRYFVEKETGIIFGAKGWKAYNPNHEYGTLETITEWNWGGYYATSKSGKTSMVPKNLRK